MKHTFHIFFFCSSTYCQVYKVAFCAAAHAYTYHTYFTLWKCFNAHTDWIYTYFFSHAMLYVLTVPVQLMTHAPDCVQFLLLHHHRHHSLSICIPTKATNDDWRVQRKEKTFFFGNSEMKYFYKTQLKISWICDYI